MDSESEIAAETSATVSYEHPLWLNERLGEAAGRGIRVAVIDSGYRSDGARPQGIAQGIGWVDAQNELKAKKSSDDDDRIGHGTAICDIIRVLAPETEIVPVRVFGRSLETSTETIVAAIDWAISQDAKVINLSLGSPSENAKVPLYLACERASRAGCLIISAIPIGSGPVYPGFFDNVIGVTVGRFENAFDLEHRPGQAAEFIAHGERRAVWNGEPALKYGSSFAAPHLSAVVALLRERFPKANLEDIRTLLTELAHASQAARTSR